MCSVFRLLCTSPCYWNCVLSDVLFTIKCRTGSNKLQLLKLLQLSHFLGSCTFRSYFLCIVLLLNVTTRGLHILYFIFCPESSQIDGGCLPVSLKSPMIPPEFTYCVIKYALHYIIYFVTFKT